MNDIARQIAADIRLDAIMPGERLEPYELESVLTRLGIPGVSVAAIVGGELEWAEAWGLADAEDGPRLTSTTLFQAGSISKPVVALAALRLVAANILELDAPIATQLRSWRLPASDDWPEPVTLRQLLSHTAGLTVHGFNGYPRNAGIPTLIEVLDGRGNSAPIRVRSRPGERYEYSGGGYLVLQQLLVDVTGKPFPQLMRELVLEPLGMYDSTYEQPLPERLWARASSGHRAAAAPVSGKWHVYPEMAAGGLWTTASDLARFITAVWRMRHAKAETSVLPQALAVEMVRQQTPDFPTGLGLHMNRGLLSFRGHASGLCFGHDGDDQGFFASMQLSDQTGSGAVVMSNADHGWMAVAGVLEALSRAYRWTAQ